MQFYSTSRKASFADFKSAVIHSLPTDNGLYFPEHIPVLPKKSIDKLRGKSLAEVGFALMQPYVNKEFSTKQLKIMLDGVFCFETPLVKINQQIHALELFHGPTYAFKDVGARFLARSLGAFSQKEGKEVTILVATSGDTGGAVAHGFLDVKGVHVVILYPSGKVSKLQEKQLTTLGKNITALEVHGDFDACQALVKQAFLDRQLNQKLNLTSANSINIARWMPQAIYYAWTSLQLDDCENTLIAVPSGNYGNITAGLLAKRMGFPLGRFVACSNANDVVPRYLRTDQYDPKETVATYANAMDVSQPSNFPRLLELCNGDYEEVTQEFLGYSLSDPQIIETIRRCKEKYHYALDPHGAIGFAALEELLQKGQRGVFLETAHPIKFAPVMEKAIGTLRLPRFAEDLMKKEKQSIEILPSYDSFKSFLLQNK